MNFITIILILSLCFSCNSRVASQDGQNFDPNVDGYVPDSNTAINIAKTILPNIYGKHVLTEEPFIAKLIGDSVWIVEGSLPKGWVGGAAHIEIRKSDCKVLHVIHGK